MGKSVKSAQGFLGFGDDPSVTAQNGNQALNQLNDQNSFYSGNGMNALNQYANGSLSANGVISGAGDGNQQAEAANALGTNDLTANKYATNQVQSNPILGQLFGQNGELSNSINTEQNLQKQGFSLQPQDYEAYGQASGNIARMFGQSANDLSSSLASRGLGSSASGAAGAGFTGLQGNKMEQLGQAQMQIANQRMQNTQQRISQQQNMISSLGQQGESAINNQMSQNLAGANYQKGGLLNTANAQTGANNAANEANLGTAQFGITNKPQNIGDMAISGLNIGGGAAAKTIGQSGGSAASAAMFA